MRSDNIKVSIICNTYNHESYIKDALDGFVMQKTNFKYEILVHDDASTDNTASIIENYKLKYPDLIKPIYQIENQYSKGVSITDVFQSPRVKGKYIAFCEGDDYWCDLMKLQKQYDIMECHPEIDICAHGAKVIDGISGNFLNYISPSVEDKIFSPEDVIMGEGGFVATNSLFYRTDMDNTVFIFRKKFPIDYTRQILGSLRGGMLYIADCMSVYRYMTPGSWTVSNSNDIKKIDELYDKKTDMLLTLDKETDGKYHNIITERLRRNTFLNLKRHFDYNGIRSKEYADLYSKMSIKEKIVQRFPWVLKLKHNFFCNRR